MTIPTSPGLALITGGAGGIGAATALTLSRDGVRTILADLDEARAASVANQIAEDTGVECIGIGLDVADRTACDTAAATVHARFGDITILINNAGINRRVSMHDQTIAASWDDVMSVNVGGVFNVVYAFLPQLRQTHGVVVNLASIQSFVHLQGSPAYSASKGAVANFTRALAVELAPHGIRVNAVAPGLTETEMTAPTRANPERMATLMQRVPMRRFASAAEIAGPICFLASPAASYMTGSVVVVDGGYLAA